MQTGDGKEVRGVNGGANGVGVPGTVDRTVFALGAVGIVVRGDRLNYSAAELCRIGAAARELLQVRNAGKPTPRLRTIDGLKRWQWSRNFIEFNQATGGAEFEARRGVQLDVMLESKNPRPAEPLWRKKERELEALRRSQTALKKEQQRRAEWLAGREDARLERREAIAEAMKEGMELLPRGNREQTLAWVKRNLHNRWCASQAFFAAGLGKDEFNGLMTGLRTTMRDPEACQGMELQVRKRVGGRSDWSMFRIVPIGTPNEARSGLPQAVR